MTKQKLFSLALFILIISGAYFFRDHIHFSELKHLIERAGIWAPLVFMLLYIVLTVLVFPVALLTMASGVLFGPWLGALYSLTGATIGATFSLLLGRYLFQATVKQRAGKLLKKIIKGVNEEGWQFVAFIRLVPLFPFNIVNYMFGLTSITVIPYMLTSYLCMAPGALAYAYIGYLGGSVAEGNTEHLIKKGLLALSLLAIMIFIPKVIMKYRK